MDYGVLMSVYKNDKVDSLKIAICSIISQTIKPNQFVIIVDGKVSIELENLLRLFEKENEFIEVFFLEKNVGLGNALNEGLKISRNNLIMRMDADDYSVPQRAEKQLEEFKKDNELDVVGSAIYEFHDDINVIESYKPVKESNEEIIKELKLKNSMNHPSVMFKKESLDEVDNYIELKFNEDYFLWVRLAIKNKKFLNIKEPLVYMRVTEDSYIRRRGYDYYLNQKELFNYMKKNSFISKKYYYFNLCNRFITKVILPTKWMKFFYLNFLRKRSTELR